MAKWIDAKGWMNDYRPKKQKTQENDMSVEETEANHESDVIVFKPLKCKCGSRKVHCYGADKPILYYKCLDCDRKFKVIEKD